MTYMSLHNKHNIAKGRLQHVYPTDNKRLKTMEEELGFSMLDFESAGFREKWAYLGIRLGTKSLINIVNLTLIYIL